MTDDEAVGESAQLDNSRRNPQPRYRRRLVRRPRATSSQQTNTVESLPSAETKRKSSNSASSPVTSLQTQITDIPSEFCDKSPKVLLILPSLTQIRKQLALSYIFFTDDTYQTNLRIYFYVYANIHLIKITVNIHTQNQHSKRKILILEKFGLFQYIVNH